MTEQMLLGHQPLIVPFDFVIQPVQRALHLRHPLHKLIALFYQQSLAGTNGLIPLLEQGDIFDQSLDLYPGGTHALHQLDPLAGLCIVVSYPAFITGNRGN